MNDGEIQIKREWLTSLREAISDNKVSEKQSYVSHWTKEEEEFIITYFHKFLGDIGYVRARHLAMALGRSLPSVRNKIDCLRAEGRMK